MIDDNVCARGGPPLPFEAIVRSGDAGTVAKRLAEAQGVRSTAAPAAWRRDGTALVTVIPTADGNSAAGRATLDRVRATTLPGEVTVGGDAALSADFLDAVYDSFPLLITLDRGEDPRHGARRRNPDRRDDRPWHPRARRRRHPRPLELVAAGLGRAHPARRTVARAAGGSSRSRPCGRVAN